MSVEFKKQSALHNHMLKQQRLVFEVAITADATPADKVHRSDIPGVVLLRTEGKVAEADAVEDLSASFTTAADNSTGDSQFGILINLDGNPAKKVKSVTVTEQTSLASSLTVTGPLSGEFLTSAGNVAIDVAGTGLALDTESPTLLVEVEYDEA